MLGTRAGEQSMPTCDVCHNDYDKAFQMTMADGRTGTFDAFECAIQAMAPRCAHCQCMAIGPGADHDATVYCCAHCARAHGVTGLDDRV